MTAAKLVILFTFRSYGADDSYWLTATINIRLLRSSCVLVTPGFGAFSRCCLIGRVNKSGFSKPLIYFVKFLHQRIGINFRLCDDGYDLELY
jgi:hypothetical protein